MKGTAIVRWTGAGSLGDLVQSVRRVLKGDGMNARARTIGGTIVVSGAEPAAVAKRLRHMPGVRWVAVGEDVRSFREMGAVAKRLAVKYLRRGDRFAVIAEGFGRGVASDVAGLVTASALGEVEGARIDERAPRMKMRAAFDGDAGVVGIEIANGPGGTPTGSAEAVCLVSGGRHSSVSAWMALLDGFRVTLVHAKVDDEGVREVARLYSELSYRADYSKLGLEVVEGGSSILELQRTARKIEGRVFGGFHAGCSEIPKLMAGRVEAPLFLLPEEEFEEAFESLGLKGVVEKQDWNPRKSGRVSRRRFAGRQADVNGVLDGLTLQRLRSS